MKAIIFSDSHGYTAAMDKAMLLHPDTEAVIHAGDVWKDIDYLYDKYPDKTIYAVAGNNDFNNRYPDEIAFTLDGVKLFVTHGHSYNVRYGTHLLGDKLIGDSIDVVIFGHTHQSLHDYYGGGQIVNPGSIGFEGSYAIMHINNGFADISIERL